MAYTTEALVDQLAYTAKALNTAIGRSATTKDDMQRSLTVIYHDVADMLSDLKHPEFNEKAKQADLCWRYFRGEKNLLSEIDFEFISGELD